MLAILEENKSLALSQKQTIDWTQIDIDWTNYFENEAPENWREQFQAVLIGVMTDAAENWNAEFGIEFDVQNLFIEPSVEDERYFAQWFENYIDVFTDEILKTTQDDLRKLLIQASENGWTIDETRKQIEANFQRYVEIGFVPTLTEDELAWFTERFPKYRLENIARTETLRAYNTGSYELYKAWGVVEQKEWLSTNDDRTRPSHVSANGQIVALNEPFVVGGYRMMYPLDGSLGAPASEICQCRCTSIPIVIV